MRENESESKALESRLALLEGAVTQLALQNQALVQALVGQTQALDALAQAIADAREEADEEERPTFLGQR